MIIDNLEVSFIRRIVLCHKRLAEHANTLLLKKTGIMNSKLNVEDYRLPSSIVEA